MDQPIHTLTRITAHSKSLLDAILTSNKERINDSGVLVHAMSDHSAVYCVMYVSVLYASYVMIM